MGHNESYVESIRSKLKHHNLPNRNITLEHLEEELIVAWNGPEIPHCHERNDRLDAWTWKVAISTIITCVTFDVSESVDNLQNRKSNFFLDEL